MTRTRPGGTVLAVLAVALAATFVLLPNPVASLLSGQAYGDEQHLTASVTAAFVAWWDVGRRASTPELAHLVDYWRWYHVVKAVAALGLLVVLTVAATRCWKSFVRNDTRGTAIGGTVLAGLAVVAFVLALANVQGACAPFSSLMSMLPVTSARGDLAVMVGQVRQQLAQGPGGGSEALARMVDDLARYHVVVAVICWCVAAGLIVLVLRTVSRWRKYARADRRARRLLVGPASASVLLAAGVVLIAVANTTAALDSPTAVLNFYRGTF
jgi:hypothetical protein